MAKKEKKPAGPVKGAIAGGVFGGLTAIVIGQNLSAAIEKSQNLTLAVIAVGAVIGGVIGVLVVRAQAKKAG